VTGDLVERGGDAFGMPGLVTRSTGIVEWPPSLTFDAWDDLGLILCEARDWTAWLLGDWLVFGEERWPDRYAQAAALTGRSYGGLRNLAWVARKIPARRRRESLSWSHHRVVAGLDEAEQTRWLDRAEAGDWSVDLLDATLRDAGVSPQRLHADGDIEVVEIAPSSGQLQVGGLSLAEIVTEILDAERDEHGRACLDRNMLERLRAALEASHE
jgi:hypothetical protein